MKRRKLSIFIQKQVLFSTQLQQWSLHGFSTSSFCKYTQALGYSEALMDHVMDQMDQTQNSCCMPEGEYLFFSLLKICHSYAVIGLK